MHRRESYREIAAPAHRAERIALAACLHEARVTHGVKAVTARRREWLTELLLRMHVRQTLLADTTIVVVVLVLVVLAAS